MNAFPSELAAPVEEGRNGVISPQVSSFLTCRGGLRRDQVRLGQPKMAIPVLKGKCDCEVFCKQMKVYTKLHGFEAVFDNDEYDEIGYEGDGKKSLNGPGGDSLYV